MSTILDDMSARTIDQESKSAAGKIPPFIISADGHVDGPLDLWDDLPAKIHEQIPARKPFAVDTRPAGGLDPAKQTRMLSQNVIDLYGLEL